MYQRDHERHWPAVDMMHFPVISSFPTPTSRSLVWKVGTLVPGSQFSCEH